MKKFILPLLLICGVASAETFVKMDEDEDTITIDASSSATVTAADALKVDITDGTQIGTAKLQVLNASTNSVSRVVTNNVGGYTDGLVLITKVYYGTTNTFYDLTD